MLFLFSAFLTFPPSQPKIAVQCMQMTYISCVHVCSNNNKNNNLQCAVTHPISDLWDVHLGRQRSTGQQHTPLAPRPFCCCYCTLLLHRKKQQQQCPLPPASESAAAAAKENQQVAAAAATPRPTTANNDSKGTPPFFTLFFSSHRGLYACLHLRARHHLPAADLCGDCHHVKV